MKLSLSVVLAIGFPGGFAAQERVWPIEAQKIVFADHKVERNFSGTIFSPSLVDLGFRQSGCISRIADGLRIGGTVEAGEELFRLDDREAQLNLAIAQANEVEQRAVVKEMNVSLVNARTQSDRQQKSLTQTQNALVRDQSLADRNLLSVTAVEATRQRLWEQENTAASFLGDVSRAEAALERSEASFARSAAETAKIELVLDQHSLVAPFDGLVTSLEASVGACVAVGQVVAQVAKRKEKQVRFFLPLAILPSVEEGTLSRGAILELSNASARTCSAVVESVAATVLEESQLVAIQAQLDPNCAETFLINEAVEVSIAVSVLKNRMALPISAVRPGDTLFVVGDEDRLSTVTLDEITYHDNQAFVRFDPGDARLVASRPPGVAMDGMAVSITTVRP